jgi:RND family efflux transporter MFP subunit
MGTVASGLYFASGWLGLDRLGRPGFVHPLSSAARRASLTISVTERGSLESVKTVDGVCEVEGNQIKIIELVPEGDTVKKGQVVCRFDASEIDKSIAKQKIQVQQNQTRVETTTQELEIAKNKAEEEITAAKVELELARLTLEKYERSDFPAEVSEMQGSIAQQASKLEEAKSKVDQMRELVKKGFRTPEQMRTLELEYEQYTFLHDRDVQKLEGKKKFEYQLKRKELQSKVDQSEGKSKRAEANSKAAIGKARSENLAAQSTLEMEKGQLEDYQKQKDKTVITAEQDGVVAYANQPYYDASRQIREGATVWSRQTIFSLPDMTNMQVKVNIHESLVKKVKVGQKAEIRVDAFPSMVLRGTVKTVSQLADSNQSFLSGGAKTYPTVVTIDLMPEESLRPGMNAEVKILVRTIPSALVVPVQCVVAHKGKHYAYVDDGNAVARREVKIGDTDQKLVEVLSGLKPGDLVAQDAQTRATEEFKVEDEKSDDKTKPSDAGSGAKPSPAPSVSSPPPAG